MPLGQAVVAAAGRGEAVSGAGQPSRRNVDRARLLWQAVAALPLPVRRRVGVAEAASRRVTRAGGFCLGLFHYFQPPPSASYKFTTVNNCCNLLSITFNSAFKALCLAVNKSK